MSKQRPKTAQGKVGRDYLERLIETLLGVPLGEVLERAAAQVWGLGASGIAPLVRIQGGMTMANYVTAAALAAKLSGGQQVGRRYRVHCPGHDDQRP